MAKSDVLDFVWSKGPENVIIGLVRVKLNGLQKLKDFKKVEAKVQADIDKNEEEAEKLAIMFELQQEIKESVIPAKL